MQLEERYFVIKRSDIEAALSPANMATFHCLNAIVRANRVNSGKTDLEVLVIEKDWPEYWPTLALLSARVDGKNAADAAYDKAYAAACLADLALRSARNDLENANHSLRVAAKEKAKVDAAQL